MDFAHIWMIFRISDSGDIVSHSMFFESLEGMESLSPAALGAQEKHAFLQLSHNDFHGFKGGIPLLLTRNDTGIKRYRRSEIVKPPTMN